MFIWVLQRSPKRCCPCLPFSSRKLLSLRQECGHTVSVLKYNVWQNLKFWGFECMWFLIKTDINCTEHMELPLHFLRGWIAQQFCTFVFFVSYLSANDMFINFILFFCTVVDSFDNLFSLWVMYWLVYRGVGRWTSYLPLLTATFWPSDHYI